MSTTARPAKSASSKNSVKFFDDMADVYDSFTGTLDSMERPMSRWMAENLPKGRRALDIGCGAGRYSVLLADLYEEIVGADPAPRMIEIAKRDRSRPNVSYQVRDALDMTPEQDGLFDVVFAFSCVHLVAKPEVILPHLAALVTPGGALFIFNAERPDDWNQENWQVDSAFKAARIAYDMTGEIEKAVNAIRTFLDEDWLAAAGEYAASEHNTLLSREGFRREYSVLPDITFEEDVFPGVLTARWQRPAIARHRAVV